jgi:hypothetical protein
MVHLIIADPREVHREMLHALPVTGTDHPLDIGRAHPRPAPIAQKTQKGRKPLRQIVPPRFHHRQPPQTGKLKSR